MGRYPFHIHNVGSTGSNSYGIGMSVHHSFQRCMVVHCTDNTYIANNTCYNIVGFAWMLVSACLSWQLPLHACAPCMFCDGAALTLNV